MPNRFRWMILGASLLLAACNQNYVDITLVSSRLDESAAKSMATYRAATTDHERIAARNRIVAIREKQVVMAGRIAVSTMPEVETHTITLEEGQKKRAALMAEAEKKLTEAKLLPIGPPPAPAAASPTAAPSANPPASSAPSTSVPARWNAVSRRRA